MSIRSLSMLSAVFSLGMTIGLTSTTQATEPTTSLPQPLTLASLMTEREIENESTPRSADLPASVTAPSEILSLASDGPFVFEPLPTRGTCVLRPDLRCTGPDYCDCTPRVYYGTRPHDDDPVLTMTPTVRDRKTTHWYTMALKMVLRKKKIAEAVNH